MRLKQKHKELSYLRILPVIFKAYLSFCCHRTGNRNEFFDILNRHSISYEKRKGTSSDEDVPLCAIVTDYRTFIDDLYKVLEFVEWVNEKTEE